VPAAYQKSGTERGSAVTQIKKANAKKDSEEHQQHMIGSWNSTEIMSGGWYIFTCYFNFIRIGIVFTGRRKCLWLRFDNINNNYYSNIV